MHGIPPPQAALNAFLSAGPHQVVKQIQKGNITKPEEVAAAATNGGEGGGGNGSSGDSPGEGEEEGPLAHDWLLADQVVQRQSSAGQVKVRGGRGGQAEVGAVERQAGGVGLGIVVGAGRSCQPDVS